MITRAYLHLPSLPSNTWILCEEPESVSSPTIYIPRILLETQIDTGIKAVSEPITLPSHVVTSTQAIPRILQSIEDIGTPQNEWQERVEEAPTTLPSEEELQEALSSAIANIAVDLQEVFEEKTVKLLFRICDDSVSKEDIGSAQKTILRIISKGLEGYAGFMVRRERILPLVLLQMIAEHIPPHISH